MKGVKHLRVGVHPCPCADERGANVRAVNGASAWAMDTCMAGMARHTRRGFLAGLAGFVGRPASLAIFFAAAFGPSAIDASISS